MLIDEPSRPWARVQLTAGTMQRRYHSHSYYDIPVFDSTSRYIAAHEMRFSERNPLQGDAITVGFVDCDRTNGFQALGESSAWSLQQGPLAQWRTNSRIIHWNDRSNGRFITRVFNLDSSVLSTLPRPTYAISPRDDFVLSLNMSRLEGLRPGYGYSSGEAGFLGDTSPNYDGVWRVDLSSKMEESLVLSLARAKNFLLETLPPIEYSKHKSENYHYWFNHVKISPDGKRFTVKLRFKKRGGSWSDSQGVSMTCGVDGSDLSLLADATSHVIWFNNNSLYMWRKDGIYLYKEVSPKGFKIRHIGETFVTANAHLRYFSNPPYEYVFDTPYREDVDIFSHNEKTGVTTHLSRFERHRPAQGPYRCDLHPCPSPDGKRVAVTSLEDGGRQIYLLERV